MTRTVWLLAATALAAAADFEIRDQAGFNQLFPKDAKVEKIAGGFQFIEGPVWIGDESGGYLVFSDIPAGQLKRWDPAGGAKVFRDPSGNANGNTTDLEGRLVTAEHHGRISRTEKDGKVVTIASTYQGKRLNSPNDVIVSSDGAIWFTDPDYGLGSRQKEAPGNYVYRLDPRTHKVNAVVTDTNRPNGLCLSPDERTLYVADSGTPRHIRAFTVQADKTVDAGRVFATIDKGAPDGIRCDQAGRVWSSAGDGVRIFSPKGTLIATVLVPESPANLGFGGPRGTTLYITARTSLYKVETLVRDGRRTRTP
jgi:gluconolactonase